MCAGLYSFILLDFSQFPTFHFFSLGRVPELHPRPCPDRPLQPPGLRHQQLQPKVQDVLHQSQPGEHRGRWGRPTGGRGGGEVNIAINTRFFYSCSLYNKPCVGNKCLRKEFNFTFISRGTVRIRKHQLILHLFFFHRFQVKHEFSGKGFCPYEPRHNSTAIFTGEKYKKEKYFLWFHKGNPRFRLVPPNFTRLFSEKEEAILFRVYKSASVEGGEVSKLFPTILREMTSRMR